jgi:hypothetical protein
MAARKLIPVSGTERGAIKESVPHAAVSLQVVTSANAVTVVALAGFIICAAVALVSTDLLIAFFQPWVHGLSLQALRPADPTFRVDAVAVGLITFGASVWVATAATATLYKAWARR